MPQKEKKVEGQYKTVWKITNKTKVVTFALDVPYI